MDWLVRLFAPRNGFDFLFRLALILLVLGGMNWLRDQLENGATADFYLPNLRESVFVGLLPSVLALMLIGHLDRLQRSLALAALTDPLTGLPNRRGFFDAAQAALPRPGGVLIMLDADHFKQVNDTHGHSAGDRCLIEIAGLMRQTVRPGDVIGRLGGEEFAVLLVGEGRQDAVDVGERLAAGVTLDLDGTGRGRTVTLSAGAVRTDGLDDLTRLMSRADAALYAAKNRGRGRLSFEPEDSPQPQQTAARRKRSG